MRPALALAAVLGAAACGSSNRAPAPQADDPWAAPAPPADPLAGWRADLETIARELPRRHPAPFTRTPEPEFRAAVAGLADALPILTDDARVVGLARLVALVGDAHTMLDPGPGSRAVVYPLVFGWFTDGIVVIDADDAHRETIGWRLTDVGSTPVADAIAALSSTFGWESEGWRESEVAWRLAWPLYLRGTGLAPAGGPVHYGLVDGTGTRRDVAVEPSMWRPGPPAADRVPLYRQQPAAFYWSRWLADQHALYVQYNKCAEAPDLSFADFTGAITALLDRHPEARLVVDLRWNTGGNSAIMRPLVDALRARPALARRLFVLIGRQTFSSGLMNAIDLDRLGAVLVGEPAGSPASHFGQVERLELPAHGLALQHSTRRFEYPGYPGPALAPEVLVQLSSADWLTGRDPVLEAALARPLPSD